MCGAVGLRGRRSQTSRDALRGKLRDDTKRTLDFGMPALCLPQPEAVARLLIDEAELLFPLAEAKFPSENLGAFAT